MRLPGLRLPSFRLTRRRVAVLLGVVFVLPLLLLYPFYGHAPCRVETRVRALRSGTELLDANGRRLGFVDQNRERFVPLSALPKHVPLAFVSVEDRRMDAWYHRGVDPVGTVAAAAQNLVPGGDRRGASTIAMQLSRALCGDRMPEDHSWSGKLAEAGLGLYLTSKLGKRQVLELYLNSVYLGRNRNGIEAAARSYFGKPATALTAADAAELAHLVASPRERDPAVRNAPARRSAITSVFERMHRKDSTFTVKRRVAPSRARPIAALPPMYRGYISRVRDGFASCTPDVNCPTSVRTFLDAGLQRSAERELTALVNRLQGTARTRAKGDTTPVREVAGIFVAMRVSTGEIVSYTGRHGRTVSNAGADLLRIGRIQPASTIKPLLLAAAIDDGTAYADETLAELMESHCPDPKVHEYLATLSGAEAPDRTISEAMLRSDNVLGACLMAGLSASSRQRLAQAGILRSVNATPADGLGLQTVAPLDLLTAYAAMRTRDRAMLPRFSGYDQQAMAPQLMSSMSADVTYNMLRDVAHEGTAWRAANVLSDDWALAGKTGTAGGGRELVFVGFARDLVGLLWVGVISGKGAVSPRHASDVIVEPWARIMRAYQPPDEWAMNAQDAGTDDDSDEDTQASRDAARRAAEVQRQARQLQKWIMRLANRIERQTM